MIPVAKLAFMLRVNLDLISQSDSDFEAECANTAAISLAVLLLAWIQDQIFQKGFYTRNYTRSYKYWESHFEF